MDSFFTELKRRNVFKVGVAYAIVAWLLIQIVVAVETPLNLPNWVDTFTILVLMLGFPVSLILAWAFELTPEGMKSTKSVAPEDSIRADTGHKLNHLITGMLVLAVLFLIIDNYVLQDTNQETETVQQTDVNELDTAISQTEPPPVIGSTMDDSRRLPKSVAILPFENLSPDPDNAYFAAGIHESTLNQLAKIQDMRVIARTSVLQYVNNPPPITEIAKALNVEMVMEGSVRYANGRVLITAQLIDGSTGTHLWSNEFNRELTDIFGVQAEVAQQIATSVQASLSPQERSRIEHRATESIEAYQHYIHAISLQESLTFMDDILLYIDSLERAIVADPNFAEAYAELAFGYFFLSDPEVVIEYAEKAISLDPTVGRAYWVLAMLYSHYFARQEDALIAYDQGIDFSPNSADTLATIGYNLADRGELTKAFDLTKRAIELNPNYAYAYIRHGYVLMRQGEYTQARKYLKDAIRLDPRYYIAYIDLAIVEYLDGNWDEAKKNLDTTGQVMSSNFIHHTENIGYLYGERALSYWTTMINDYLSGNERNALVLFRYKDLNSAINRFKDNWLNDPMLEEPEFLELRRRLGYEG